MENKSRLFLAAATIVVAGLFMSAKDGDSTMTKDGSTTIVNTQLIGKKIKGYNGNTPVKIFISKGKVVKIESLPNHESPAYFRRAKKVLTAWNGTSASKAYKQEVDGVSGATYSSEALINNVKLGLKYYKEHK